MELETKLTGERKSRHIVDPISLLLPQLTVNSIPCYCRVLNNNILVCGVMIDVKTNVLLFYRKSCTLQQPKTLTSICVEWQSPKPSPFVIHFLILGSRRVELNSAGMRAGD